MLNSISIVGRLVRDPELRYTTNNKTVADFTIACNRISEGVDYIRCECWGKQAENLNKYTSKGDLVSINGKLRTDNFTDKEGNKRTTTYILANEISYITTGKKGEKVQEAINTIEESVKETVNDPFEEFGNEISDEELPF